MNKNTFIKLIVIIYFFIPSTSLASCELLESDICVPPKVIRSANINNNISVPTIIYPTLSKRLGEQGTVILNVLVSVSGDVSSIEIKQSSGFERLDKAAVVGVRDWLFEPAQKNGVAVEAWLSIPIPFKLVGNQAESGFPEHKAINRKPGHDQITSASYLAGNKLPEYPYESKKRGEQGVVTLRVLVLEDGSVGEVVIKNTSSFAALDDAALNAVKTWRFNPAKQNDHAISEWYELKIPFRLKTKNSPYVAQQPYISDEKNIQLLKTISNAQEKIKVGIITTNGEIDRKLTCRLGSQPLSPWGEVGISTYIKNALNSDFSLAGIYGKDAFNSINIVIDLVRVNTVYPAGWAIRANVRDMNANEFEVEEKSRHETFVDLDQACQKAADVFPTFLQSFIAKIISNPKFPKMVNRF